MLSNSFLPLGPANSISMNFESGLIFHVYNQGNNKEKIFYQGKNYKYFLGKMEELLKPHGDILSYCLMPNHFHWLLFVNSVEVPTSNRRSKPIRSLNDSIAILLRSYARAINIQEGRVGSLFREGTKAKNGLLEGVVSIEGPNAHEFFKHGNEYAIQCFRYIHRNPVKAGLVVNPEDWPWSSAQEYANVQNGETGICNVELGRKILLGLI